MATVPKTNINVDTSNIVDGPGNTIDAGDVTVPILEGRDHIRAGRVAAIDSATHVGTLDDVITVTAPVVKSVTNPTGDARLNVNVSDMVGATVGMDGVRGLVPQPLAGDHVKFLRGDKQWVAAPGTGTVTEIDASVPTDALAVSGVPITGAGTIAISKANVDANLVAAGPASGAAAAWAFRGLAIDDLPKLAFEEIIPNTVLGSAASQIDFGSGGSPLPQSYNALLLVLRLRSDRASSSDSGRMRFNGDTTAANYTSLMSFVSSNGASSAVERLAGAANALEVTFMPGATSPSNEFSPAYVLIENYTQASQRKGFFSLTFMRSATTTGNMHTINSGGYWLNTANPINYITIFPQVGTNLAAGSAYALYGIGAN